MKDSDLGPCSSVRVRVKTSPYTVVIYEGLVMYIDDRWVQVYALKSSIHDMHTGKWIRDGNIGPNTTGWFFRHQIEKITDDE